MTVTLNRRERQRAATVEEIKEVARGLMRDQGTTEVRFTDIAKEMGMTAPALYRYYADRDELLTALITDAYRELGRAVAEARESRGPDDIAGRWVAAGTAYRDWARREPAQFALILGLPVPGYVAPEDGQTTEAAKDAMAQLAALFIRAAELGVLGEPLVREVSDEMAACAADKHPELSEQQVPAGELPGDDPGLGHPARHHHARRLRPVRLDVRRRSRPALRQHAQDRRARRRHPGGVTIG